MRSRRQTIASAFGYVLAELRDNAGISAEDLEIRANLDPSYPSMLENGTRSPTIETIYALAKGLNIDPETLITKTSERLAIRARDNGERLLPEVPASKLEQFEPQLPAQAKTAPVRKAKLQGTPCAHKGTKTTVGNVIRCNQCNRVAGFVRAPNRKRAVGSAS